MLITRRNMMAILASAAGAHIGTRAYANEQRRHADEQRPALRELADGKGIIIGSAMSRFELNTDDRRLFARELAGITPENALKMGAIRPAQDAWRFEEADALTDFAAEFGMRVRGHALIWNNDQQPTWLQSLSEAEMRAAMQEHIELTMSRYEQRVKIWDVVNEPIGTVAYEPYWLREGPFLARLGPDYIAESFRMARATAPNAKLVLNETHTERDDRFGLDYRRNLLFLIDRLQDAGVPIDGIGLQGHLQSAVHFDLDESGQFLSEISSRKLFIEVTEIDVNDDAFAEDENSRDQAVADFYRRYLDHVLTNQAVKSVTFWQLGDRASWYSNVPWTTTPRAETPARVRCFSICACVRSLLFSPSWPRFGTWPRAPKRQMAPTFIPAGGYTCGRSRRRGRIRRRRIELWVAVAGFQDRWNNRYHRPAGFYRGTYLSDATRPPRKASCTKCLRSAEPYNPLYLSRNGCSQPYRFPWSHRHHLPSPWCPG